MNPVKHKTPIQIRFKDIDRLGHVNNANYFTYFELARVDYFDKLAGKEVDVDWNKEGMILARVEMDYKQPIFLNDQIYVYTWISKLGNKSFDANCSIVKALPDGTEIEMAKGLAVIVCFNYQLNQAIPIPQLWRDKMKNML